MCASTWVAYLRYFLFDFARVKRSVVVASASDSMDTNEAYKRAKRGGRISNERTSGSGLFVVSAGFEKDGK